MILSSADQKHFAAAQRAVMNHDSGGSYSMIASWRGKGSARAAGFNSLQRCSKVERASYPEVCGMHAELDLYLRFDHLDGGTVAVAGVKRNGRVMANTRPCAYCAAILTQMGVDWVLYRSDEAVVKSRPSDILDELRRNNNGREAYRAA